MRHYGPLQPRLSRYARALSRDDEEARDLVAEATLQAYERFDSLRDHNAFLSWIFTITTRIYRKKGIRGKYHADWDQEKGDQIKAHGSSPDRSADVRLLYDALARLPEEQREAVTLFEIADVPLKEIARIQGVSLSGAKSRVTRGRARLAELLGVTEQNSAIERDGTEQSEPGHLLFINAA